MKSIFKIVAAVLLLTVGGVLSGEGKFFSWDFSGCDIRDILFSVSLDTGISIAADDTVCGKGNFRFAGSDFETAFDSFLNSERLYVKKEDNLWTVSKFRSCCENGKIGFDAFDLTAMQILDKLSMVMDSVVSFDSLPGGSFSVHLKMMSEKELLENLVLRFSGYELIENDNGFYIGKKTNSIDKSGMNSGFVQVKFERDGTYWIEAKDCKTLDVLNRLFDVKSDGTKREFCFLAGNDSKVIRTCFSGKTFDEVLNKFCVQNGLETFKNEDVYYIVADSNSKEKLNNGYKSWTKIDLNYMKAEKFSGILSKRIGKIENIILPDGNGLLCKLNDTEKEIVEELISVMDVKSDAFLIGLKYLKPEDLLKHLSPGIDKSCLVLADDKSCVYFTGSKKAFEEFNKELELVDKPVDRISYDLLILQFEDGMEDSFSGNLSLERLSAGDRNDFAVQLGSVLNLNLDVISAFGINFAGNLACSIENNKTKIFADTTLCGISGRTISFKNTNTYRYRDNNLDPETGKPVYSGVTKEIISGLKLDVTGWISGDGMITSSISASVTRQGNDSSSKTGNPPPTSEKIITTEVCGRNGEPVILSGLIENSQTFSEAHTPLLSKIPLIGWFFKNKETLSQNSQMVIYLVPHIEQQTLIINQNKENEKDWNLEKCRNFVNKVVCNE